MSVLYVLIPVAAVFAAGAIVAFIWATRNGQFDDLDTPAVRMLFDDEDAQVPDDDPEASDREA